MGSIAVVLVGHGGVPQDFPREDLLELKRLEGARRARGEANPGEREQALDQSIRHWPRTPQNDPYRVGFTRIAAAFQARLGDRPLYVAFNEFCAPSLGVALLDAMAAGVRRIVVIPTMITPGGSHTEVEIPETLEALRRTHPDVELRYAWPYAAERLAELFAAQVAEALA